MPAGRPSDYTPQLADLICELIQEGNSVRQICLMDEMPDRGTVLRWLDIHEDFATKYARARVEQAELMDEKILRLAEECTEENYQSTRVRMAAYQWRAAKLSPKRYGERVDFHNHPGAGATLTLNLPPGFAEKLAQRMGSSAAPELPSGHTIDAVLPKDKG